MRIKSYYARAVEDAISAARQELGAEAMLVNTRKAPPESGHQGEYEVVFALAPDTAAEPAPHTPAGEQAGSPAAPADRLSREVAELRRQLEGMRRTLARPAGPSAPLLPENADAYVALTAAEVAPELAGELVEAAEARVARGRQAWGRAQGRSDPQEFERALAEEMKSRSKADPALGLGSGHPAKVALVGPPGAGKTTTLVKLAVNYGLTSRRPVLLLSIDTYRVAAAEQLRSYAAILGVAFQLVETVGALGQALEENRGKDLILIDTPGLAAGDLDCGADLARFLSSRPDIDTHLVLTASMKSADLTRLTHSYEIFHPHHLIFTRLDETGSFGPILNQAVRTARPLSFFAGGQRIPEDLEIASCERLVELVLSGRSGQALSAA
jgi:flagellar biosynthesis protein FlhF